MLRAPLAGCVFQIIFCAGLAVAAPLEKAPRQETVRTHTPSSDDDAARHRQGCQQGEAAACHAAALDAFYRPSAPATDRAAFEFFKKACAAGYAPSCNGLGVLYAQGRGVAKDLARAAHLYYDACAAGASTGCEHLAEALQRGTGIAEDAAAARRARERARCITQKPAADRAPASCPALLPLISAASAETR
jgi:TPR repeat protein